MSNTDVLAAVPGIFYRSPGPGKDPYVVEGDRVEAGAVIGLTEIMKQFSEVTTSVAGTVSAFLVENGAMITPGQSIATIQEG